MKTRVQVRVLRSHIAVLEEVEGEVVELAGYESW